MSKRGHIAVTAVLTAALAALACYYWGQRMYENGYDRGTQEMAVAKEAWYLGMLTNIAGHPLLHHSREDKLVFRKWQEEELRELLAKKAVIDSSRYKDLIYNHMDSKVFVENSAD